VLGALTGGEGKLVMKAGTGGVSVRSVGAM